MVDLQYCVGFRCTAKRINYTDTWSHFLRFFPHIGHYKVLSVLRYTEEYVKKWYIYTIFKKYNSEFASRLEKCYKLLKIKNSQ